MTRRRRFTVFPRQICRDRNSPGKKDTRMDFLSGSVPHIRGTGAIREALRGPIAVSVPPHQRQGTDLHPSMLKLPSDTELRVGIAVSSGFRMRDRGLRETLEPANHDRISHLPGSGELNYTY